MPGSRKVSETFQKPLTAHLSSLLLASNVPIHPSLHMPLFAMLNNDPTAEICVASMQQRDCVLCESDRGETDGRTDGRIDWKMETEMESEMEREMKKEGDEERGR